MATVQDRLQSIIDKANQTTGKTDADVTAATQSLVDGFGGGGGFEYATMLAQTFRNSVFPAGCELEIRLGENFGGNAVNCFLDSKNLKTIKFYLPKGKKANVGNLFNGCTSLTTCDFGPDGISLSNAAYMFQACRSLTSIIGPIDFSGVSELNNHPFIACAALENVTFAPESIKYSFSTQWSPKLTVESLQSVIDALSSVASGQTVTFHLAAKARLTPEQIAQITSKNWNFA